ncbi:MAG: MFS transporter [Anaerolineales bacterium]|nr:MFS transporter [Anaerolineales bacterium]MBX3038671.1 MFS transporter [Anaerolineales bacterium]
MPFNLFRQSDIPEKYRSNFTNLYLDIAWFGVLSGTAVNFLNIYAARLGATGLQIGLLTAGSAIVTLFLAIPSGHWISKRHTGRAVFWSSVLFRIGYLFWIPLPWIFDEQGQIWSLIVITFLMAIPLTPLGVGFNALFAEAVPDQYRARVAGTRNVTFAIAYMLSSLIAGYILDNTPFTAGYQIIFAIGAFGAAMSSYHIYHVKPLEERTPPLSELMPDSAIKPESTLRLDIWKTPFRKVLLGLLFFHLAQYISTPLYPLYNVNVLHLNDNHIGIGTALYYSTVLLSSTQLGRIVQRFGHKRVTGWGAFGVGFYPLTLAFAQDVFQFYLISFFGGFLFALVNGAYANYMLEHIPPHDRPSHLAWYTIILNFAILSSSIAGPLIGDAIGLVPALILFGFMRFASGFFILRK